MDLLKKKKYTPCVNCSWPSTPLPVSDYIAITSAHFPASDGTKQAAQTYYRPLNFVCKMHGSKCTI